MTIDEKTTEHLAELARIKVTEAEKRKITGDLEDILAHFKELAELSTADILPVTGGTELTDVFKEDEENDELTEKGKAAFPEEEKGFLKVPAVFEKTDNE